MKLEHLKSLIKERGLDGFIIPSCDEYQSEYVPEQSNRLKYITGFTGSNGIAVITLEHNFFFTDGRYLLQAKNELDKSFHIYHIKDFFLKGKIGFDPKLHQKSFFANCKGQSIESENLIDLIWERENLNASSAVFDYPIKFAGVSTSSKQKLLIEYLNSNNLDALVITKPENTCWLLNIRSHDIEFNPILLCYSIFYADGRIEVFANSPKFYPLQKFSSHLESLSKMKVQLDSESASIWVINHIEEPILKEDPIYLLKAVKNKTEIAWARKKHVNDAVSICKTIFWLEENYKKTNISELDLIAKLEENKKLDRNYLYPSFATICGFAENAAVIHYRSNEKTNKIIKDNNLLLLDCGSQYFGATTDITRTLALGKISKEQKINYTLVLKGHIALAKAVFPIDTPGMNLDILARQFLYANNKDYAHGTGHGVGSCLSVHEAPQRINRTNSVPLVPGMIISNEPGYYEAGKYGIRLENLILVKKHSNNFLHFETLSLVPFDLNAIMFNLLDKHEIKWLKSYHNKIYKLLSPLLDLNMNKWLRKKCFSNKLN